MSETDGVTEALDDSVRIAVTAAARVAEAMARLRTQLREQAAAESTARTRQLEARTNAEMTAARATYRDVDDPAWWATAKPEDMAVRYRTAAAWRDVDPEAARAEQHLARELKDRYGLDVHAQGGATLGPDLDRAVDELARAGRAVDLAEATVLLQAADRAQDNQHDRLENGHAAPGAPEWDTAERREVTARDLTAATRGQHPLAVEAKMLADQSQAAPATAATHGAKTRGTKARPAAARGTQRQRQRGLGR